MTERSKRPLSRSVGVLSALILAACGSEGSAPSPADPILSDRISPAIDSIVQARIGVDGPGAAVLVVRGRTVLHAKGYGRADLGQRRPITPVTSMRMGSVSKQFTAMAVMLAADEGLLSLNDPVTNYFDAPVYAGITIRHLLQHTSGLAEYFDTFEAEWDRSKIVQNQDLVDWYTRANPEPAFAPGDAWEYSNGGYSLLASIVAKASGMPFPAYTHARIFDPLEMEHSLFFNLAEPAPIPNRAFCYSIDDEGAIEQVDGNYMNGILGEGGLYTTLLDYAKWDRALRDGRLLSSSVLAEAFTPAVLNDGRIASQEVDDDAPAAGYGYGWSVSLGDGPRIASHGGGWYGVRTYTLRTLDDGYTIAVFMNRDDLDPAEITRDIEALLTG